MDEDNSIIVFVYVSFTVGLDAAGKTTILYKLKLGEVVTTIPTIGTYKKFPSFLVLVTKQNSLIFILPKWVCYVLLNFSVTQSYSSIFANFDL